MKSNSLALIEKAEGSPNTQAQCLCPFNTKIKLNPNIMNVSLSSDSHPTPVVSGAPERTEWNVLAFCHGRIRHTRRRHQREWSEDERRAFTSLPLSCSSFCPFLSFALILSSFSSDFLHFLILSFLYLKKSAFKRKIEE